MELKKDTNLTNNVNVISTQSTKTPFGILYAVILIVLLVVMGTGQFFFPVLNAKSSDDEKSLIGAKQQADEIVKGEREPEKYEYEDFLPANIAKLISPAGEKELELGYMYTIGAKNYPLSLNNDKHSISLSNLVDGKYKLDISCKKNHSKLIVSVVLGISCVCLIVCLVFAIIGIIHLMNDTNKSCIYLSLAFIPMALAKLTLMLTALPIKNFRCIAVNHIALVIDSPHTSIFLILMLVISICIPIISLKVIRRT